MGDLKLIWKNSTESELVAKYGKDIGAGVIDEYYTGIIKLVKRDLVLDQLVNEISGEIVLQIYHVMKLINYCNYSDTYSLLL